MSAFGGKADMTFCGNSLSRSLLGVERTSLFAAQMSAFDPYLFMNNGAETFIVLEGQGRSLFLWISLLRL
jgi:hypothetical protein